MTTIHQFRSLLLTVLIMSVTIALGQTSSYLLASITSLYYLKDGGIQTFIILSNTEWTVNCDADWLVVSPSTGTGDATVTVNATHNTGSERFATITIIGHEMTECVTVLQMGYTPPPIPSNLSFSASGGAQHLILTTNFNWTISVEGGYGWLTVTPVSGSNETVLTVSASDNPTTISRLAIITFTNISGAKYQIHVTQLGCPTYLIVNTTQLFLSQVEHSLSFEIISNTDWTISVEEDVDWLTVTPVSGNNEATIKVTVLNNDVNYSRSAKINITWSGGVETVLVQQLGDAISDIDGLKHKQNDVNNNRIKSFDLFGRPLLRNKRGIAILDGQKIFIK